MYAKATGMLGLVAVLAAGCAGCETPRSGEVGGEESSQDAPVEGSVAVVERAAALRDRAFDVPVKVEVLEAAEALWRSGALPEAVEAERGRLSRGLYGDAGALKLEVDRSWGSRAAAEVGEDEVQVRQVGRGASARWASAVAASRALEVGAFGELSPASTVDGWLAREVVLSAGPMLASTLAVAEADGMAIDAALLARRPDLAERVKGVGALLAGEGDVLGRAVMREALALGAALFRAQGWSGVEWGRSEGGKRSLDVVRPDRWLAGDGEASWQWPSEYEEVQKARRWELAGEGSVGPLLASAWLEGVLDARGARSIFGAWLADAYRVYEGPGEEGQAFVWLTAWRTPHEAQQVAQAMEGALLQRLGREARGGKMRVAVQGLNVVLTSYESAQDPELLDDEIEALAGAAVAFLPEEPAPLRFEATTYERYVEAAEEATLEGSTWIDPAAGWKMSLGALEGWTVQKSDEVHVRWFATHEDGSLVQWTAELVDPLGPAFGSSAYVEHLTETFAASVKGSEPQIVIAPSDAGPRVQLLASGKVEDQDIELRLWQWERGEVIVSYSVQEPASGFGLRLGEAESALETLETFGEELVEAPERIEPGGDGEDRSDESKGILEFRVEGE